jgi:hypothetical protein
MAAPNDLALLKRFLGLDQDDLSAEFAREALRWQPREEDRERMHELLVKNQNDNLTTDERAELDSFIRVTRFLDQLRSKARLTLKKSEALR